MKVDPLLLAVLQRICFILFHKKLRPGKTETVYTLLNVPYHKDIFPPVGPAGNHSCDHLLDIVAVLIFVDKNLVVFLRKFPGGLGGGQLFSFFSHQNLQCEMLHICKIQKIFLPLFLRKTFLKGKSKLHKAFHRLFAAGQKFQKRAFPPAEIPGG